MLTIRKILVPTDFSDNAATAYNVAQQLATGFKAKVDFIHVIQTLNYYTRSLAKLKVADKTDEELYLQLEKQAFHRIRKVMDDYLKPDNQGEGIVQIAAKPFMEIADYACEEEYDLIVMGTLGEDDSNFLIGSVAEKVVRYSKVPVLTTGKTSLDTIKNIVIPIDGSRLSFETIPMAVSIASIFDADITLFHVHQLPGTVIEGAQSSPCEIDEKNIRNTIYTDLENFLTHLWDQVELRREDDSKSRLVYKEGASSSTININMVIERGVSAHHAITGYAAKNGDLVVMTTHDRSGLAHVFIGSTAENVVRHVKLPVITVKPDFEKVPHATVSI